MSRHVAKLLLGLAPFALFGWLQNGTSRGDGNSLPPPSDPIASLVRKINSGEITLTFEPNQGYLRAILRHLNVSSASQILVFSKTSVQAAYISPTNPRAVYFNDRAYIGWIRGAPNIELMGIDPVAGPKFYTLVNEQVQKPTLIRQGDECMQCHDSGLTDHIPGLLVRSVFAGPDGTPKFAGGSTLTTPASPMKERWGGWYVTGQHGDQRHMGNEVARGDDQHPFLDMDKGANVSNLKGYFDVDSYLTPHSDLVALMVAEQQMAIQNLITKAGKLTRKALDEATELRKFGFTEEHVSNGTMARIRYVCEPLVVSLTGADEDPLTEPVRGTSTFATLFSASSPADQTGRRLSELDLKSRLLKFPLSPMVYAPCFAALPSEAKSYVMKRLIEVLLGKDHSTKFARLNLDRGKEALEILSDTLPGSGWTHLK